MKRFHYLLALALVLSGCEAKGQGENMKNRIGNQNIGIHSEDGQVTVRLPIKWDEDLTNVKVWFDPVPVSPPIMPYMAGKNGAVKKNSISVLGATYSEKQFDPGKNYVVTVKIEGVEQNGKIYVNSQQVEITVPAQGDMSGSRLSKADKSMTASGSQYPQEKAEAMEKYQARRLKADVEVDVKKVQGGTQYTYRIRNKDNAGAITSFYLEIKGPMQIIGTPKGWRSTQDLPVAATGVGWITQKDNAIPAGRALNGFQVVGSPNKTNVLFSLVGGQKVASGLTVGPGE